MTQAERYTHGHHGSVLRSHRWRTAENSAAYLLPHLEPGSTLLDVGCGPGTITVDLARRLSPGAVIGMDAAAVVIEQAAAEPYLPENVRFVTGDAYDLQFPDGSFSIVHAHQVLQYLSDPVRALAEMRRVCAPGGVVAARDADYASIAIFPHEPLLDRWLKLYDTAARSNHGEPNA